MPLVLMLGLAVVVALRAPAERDRLQKQAKLVASSESSTARVDASEMEETAARFDRLARGSLWVARGLAVVVGLELLSALIGLHG